MSESKLERVRGARCVDGLGYPTGCTALIDDALAGCRAERQGRHCLLCVRKGAFPWPKEWTGPGWNIAGRITVQAVRYARDSKSWVVVVMLGGRRVDGRYPPIYCQSKRRALDLAFQRARQIEPRAAIKPWLEAAEQWACGRVVIIVADSY